MTSPGYAQSDPKEIRRTVPVSFKDFDAEAWLDIRIDIDNVIVFDFVWSNWWLYIHLGIMGRELIKIDR